MAIFERPGGCCGDPGFYLDTDKVSAQAKILSEAGVSMRALVGSADFAGAANSFVGSDLAAILSKGTGVIDAALSGHAGLMQSTGEGFTRVVADLSAQDQANAGALGQETDL